MNKLAQEILDRMPELTVQKASDASLVNAKGNQQFIERTLLDLPKQKGGYSSAIAIGAGPSLHRTESIKKIVDSGYKGPIIAADGAMGHCLRGGLVPDYVISLDPGPIATGPDRMLRWFGDPDLDQAKLDRDDYFRRQDLDIYVGNRELERNLEMVELVNRHGPNISAIMATSLPPVLSRRAAQAGMKIYWWNPLFDDFNDPESFSARIFQMNKVPCMVSGGNVGAAAWVFAHAVLGTANVAVVGMDFSYAPETPIKNTPYYKELEEIFGDRAEEAFIDVENPYLGETWFTDPTYYWYRQSFLDMAQKADCKTYNCTEGGILFGDDILCIPLEEFLNNPAHNVAANGATNG